MARHHIHTRMTHMIWYEEDLKNVKVLQKVHLSNFVNVLWIFCQLRASRVEQPSSWETGRKEVYKTNASSIPVTPLQSIGLQQSSANALYSELVLLTSFHVLHAFPSSSTTVLFQVILGLSLLRCPWGFQFRAWFSMAVGPFRRVCPIHFHFLHLICCYKGVSWARLRSSSIYIVFGQKILKIFLRLLFMKVCKYCDMSSLSGVAIVTWWLLLHSSEFVVLL
jgi:hypothetical protein